MKFCEFARHRLAQQHGVFKSGPQDKNNDECKTVPVMLPDKNPLIIVTNGDTPFQSVRNSDAGVMVCLAIHDFFVKDRKSTRLNSSHRH